MVLGSEIRDPEKTQSGSRIPDTGVKKAPDPGCGSATLSVTICRHTSPWRRSPSAERTTLSMFACHQTARTRCSPLMNNPDHIFQSSKNHFFAFFGVKILKFFDEDPGSGMGDSSDPGSGMEKSRIRDKHPRSATLKIGGFMYLLVPFLDKIMCSI